jgi:hypothetical protein
MRAFVLMSLMIVLTAAGGWAICRATGIDPRVRDMLIAATVCLLAGAASIVPLVLTRGASQLAVVQAALVATMIHLFGMLALAVVVVSMRLAGYGSFLYWLMAFYFATLPALVAALVPIIRHATPAAPPAPPTAAGKH